MPEWFRCRQEIYHANKMNKTKQTVCWEILPIGTNQPILTPPRSEPLKVVCLSPKRQKSCSILKDKGQMDCRSQPLGAWEGRGNISVPQPFNHTYLNQLKTSGYA